MRESEQEFLEFLKTLSPADLLPKEEKSSYE